MNLKCIFLIIIISIFISSCADYKTTKKDEKQYFTSSGFALIYDEDLYAKKIINKKINNQNLEIMHHILKKNSIVRIINPMNMKTIETKVFKQANYPKIFNVVISEKIASILELDKNNPYVEVVELKKNKTFVAKESDMFEEEKKVAEKAPVNEIKIDDLSKIKSDVSKKNVKKNNFTIIIADFYYYDSASNLMNELIKKAKIKNISVKKINDTKYRLFVGPYKNFNALKTVYISLNNLGFDNLNIFNE